MAILRPQTHWLAQCRRLKTKSLSVFKNTSNPDFQLLLENGQFWRPGASAPHCLSWREVRVSFALELGAPLPRNPPPEGTFVAYAPCLGPGASGFRILGLNPVSGLQPCWPLEPGHPWGGPSGHCRASSSTPHRVRTTQKVSGHRPQLRTTHTYKQIHKSHFSEWISR